MRSALAVVATASSAITMLGVPPAVASADQCSDVEVIFARGTDEPPGLGRVGQAFVDALVPQLGARTVNTYAVNYPASINFLTTAVGGNDAAAHVAAVARECPGTSIVLGGFSQGAAVVDMLAGVAPLGTAIGTIGSAPPLAPDLAERVTAAAVFGNPSNRFDAPLSTTGLFAGKAIDVCNPADPICSAAGDSRAAHNAYEFQPYPEQASEFVANFL